MSLLTAIKNRLSLIYRQYILREPLLVQAARWFRDQGDKTLRLDYPLTSQSVVFDVGGYRGDFSAAINDRYGCKIYVFEPVPEFHRQCVNRFRGNPNILCLNFGLSSVSDWLDIKLAENASGFVSPFGHGTSQRVEVRSITQFLRELEISHIDLLKINIEGGEFDVLPALIESGDIKNVQYLQVQFHNFVSHAAAKRDAIRNDLIKTHAEMWNYEFVWESWQRKEHPIAK